MNVISSSRDREDQSVRHGRTTGRTLAGFVDLLTQGSDRHFSTKDACVGISEVVLQSYCAI
jgi:hypothetical protein